MAFVCRYCKKEFVPKYKNNKNVLCSNECKYKETSERQRIIALLDNPVYKPGVSKKIRDKRIENNTYPTGEDHHNWKSGSWLSMTGYRVIQNKRETEGKKILEHRKIMAEFIGRELTKDEIIHHINGNKVDNRPENLTIMTRSEHLKHHLFGKLR